MMTNAASPFFSRGLFQRWLGRIERVHRAQHVEPEIALP